MRLSVEVFIRQQPSSAELHFISHRLWAMNFMQEPKGLQEYCAGEVLDI